jgi:flagellar hook protein FlgE
MDFGDIRLSIDPTGTAGIQIPDGESLTVGTVVPSSVTMTISTFNKSGEAVTATGTWTAPGNTLQLGDIALPVNPAAFGTMDINARGERSWKAPVPGPGIPQKIAHMATVKFINADGLSQDGEGYYVETTNSGDPIASIPGSGGLGNLRSGALEMSIVDLSKEFTEMIITQRGFQANTRMITVSDEMLSELVNMKR